MARQIIKQPNGLYCLFSSYVDSIVQWNLTADQIIDFLVEEQKKLITHEVSNIISKLNKREKPYHQFTLTYKRALAMTRKRYPEDYEKMKKDVETMNSKTV